MKTLEEIININSKTFNLNPLIIKSIIIQESRSPVDLLKNNLKEINTFAFKHEQDFIHRYIPKELKNYKGYIPKTVTEEKEKYLRASSFGCMQILGQTAREQGFSCESLYQLFDLELNIYYGCKYFRYLLNLKGGDTNSREQLLKALDNWNGGGNPRYKTEVMNWFYTEEYLKYNWSYVA